MKTLGIGVSTSVGIGGDPINGSSFKDILELFEKDDETDAVVMIGEIGGPQEAEAAEWAKANMKKPLIAYIAGHADRLSRQEPHRHSGRRSGWCRHGRGQYPLPHLGREIGQRQRIGQALAANGGGPMGLQAEG